MKNLLLLHGALGDKSQFDLLIPSLSNFRPEAIDFTGHGSRSEDTGFGIQSFAKDVISWLDNQQIDKTDIFGYSMGGYVALWLKLLYPERIGRVMTLATKFNWTPESAKTETRFLDPERIEQKVPAFAKKLATTHGDDKWKQLLHNTAAMMTDLGNKPMLNNLELGSISGKVLISVGDMDGMVSLEESIEAYRWVPEASFLVLPGTVHPIEKANTTDLAYHINRFFSE